MSMPLNTSGQFSVTVVIDPAVFPYTNIQEFVYKNELNKAPYGEFIVLDTNSDLMSIESGGFGVIRFKNVSDDLTEKNTVLPITIDSIEMLKIVSPNTTYKIKWTAGNPRMLQRGTKAVSGTSPIAIKDVFKEYGFKFDNRFESSSLQSDDAMMWRWCKENFWERLDTVVKYSFIHNDYIFWCWDDVNGQFKISSFGIELGQELRYIMTFSQDANTPSGTNMTVNAHPMNSTYQFGAYVQMNTIGQSKEQLFPNVSFQGYVSNNLESAGFKSSDFLGWLRDIGDKKLEEVIASTGFDNPNYSFGELKIRRYYGNNTYKFYSVSDIYRDYISATWGKIIYVTLFNTMGPPLGSKITIKVPSNAVQTQGLTYNEYFSDSYILSEKTISLTQIETNNSGEKVAGDVKMMTILKLISNNFAANGTKAIEELDKFAKTKVQV